MLQLRQLVFFSNFGFNKWYPSGKFINILVPSENLLPKNPNSLQNKLSQNGNKILVYFLLSCEKFLCFKVQYSPVNTRSIQRGRTFQYHYFPYFGANVFHLSKRVAKLHFQLSKTLR